MGRDGAAVSEQGWSTWSRADPRRSRSTRRSSSAPACAGSTSCTDSSSWASARRCWRPVPTSAARGTGTATRAPGSTPRASRTATRSPRSCSRSGTGRSGSRGSRRTSATSTTSPTSSTSAGTCSSTAPSSRPSSTTTPRCGACTLADGRELTCRFLIPAVGLLSAPTLPRYEGLDEFEGRSFHTYDWPEEPIDFTGKRVAVIGTGATGVQVIGAIADQVGELTVFQRRPELVRTAAQRRDHARGDGRHQVALRRDLRDLRPHAGRLPARAGPPAVLRGAPRGAAGEVGAAVRRAGLRHLAGQLPRHLHGRGGQRRVLRVHRRQDPLAGRRPRRGREADPQGPRLRGAAGADGDPVLRGLQPAQRAPRRPPGDADRAHHADRHPHDRAGTTSSTSSSTPPASTPSPAPTTASTSAASAARRCATSGPTGRSRSSACRSTASRT